MGIFKRKDTGAPCSAIQIRFEKLIIVLKDPRLGEVTTKALAEEFQSRYRRIFQGSEKAVVKGFSFTEGGDLIPVDDKNLQSLGFQGDSSETNILYVVVETPFDEDAVQGFAKQGTEIEAKKRSCNCFGWCTIPNIVCIPGWFFFWFDKVFPKIKAIPEDEWAVKEFLCAGQCDNNKLGSMCKDFINLTIRKSIGLIRTATCVWIPHVSLFSIWDIVSSLIYMLFLYIATGFLFYLSWLFWDYKNTQAIFVFCGTFWTLVVGLTIMLGNTYITDLLVEGAVKRESKIESIKHDLAHQKDQLVNYESEEKEDGILLKQKSAAPVPEAAS